MPSVTIKKADLPPVDGDGDAYNVRVRMISQDRNRSSFWTPTYTVVVPPADGVLYAVKTDLTGIKTATVVWDSQVEVTRYDVYVKWKNSAGDTTSDWTFFKTTPSNSIGLIDPGSKYSFFVAVQRESYPKKRMVSQTLFESTEYTL